MTLIKPKDLPSHSGDINDIALNIVVNLYERFWESFAVFVFYVEMMDDTFKRNYCVEYIFPSKSQNCITMSRFSIRKYFTHDEASFSFQWIAVFGKKRTENFLIFITLFEKIKNENIIVS